MTKQGRQGQAPDQQQRDQGIIHNRCLTTT
jgi:hypothetical protein